MGSNNRFLDNIRKPVEPWGWYLFKWQIVRRRAEIRSIIERFPGGSVRFYAPIAEPGSNGVLDVD